MKKAFSLLELCFTIVILGIVFAVAKLNFKDNKLDLAAKQILNDLAYTRNLALIQNSFKNSGKSEWFKARWQLYFIRSKSATNNEQTYTIFLDKNADGNANIGKSDVNLDREIAVDILNPQKLMNSGQSGVIDKDDERVSARFNIQKSYGVERVEFKGACSAMTRIIFDEFGRVHSPLRTANKPYEKALFHKNEACVIKLIAKDEALCIVIDTLSGYAYLAEFIGFNGKKYECIKL